MKIGHLLGERELKSTRNSIDFNEVEIELRRLLTDINDEFVKVAMEQMRTFNFYNYNGFMKGNKLILSINREVTIG